MWISLIDSPGFIVQNVMFHVRNEYISNNYFPDDMELYLLQYSDLTLTPNHWRVTNSSHTEDQRTCFQIGSCYHCLQ